MVDRVFEALRSEDAQSGYIWACQMMRVVLGATSALSVPPSLQTQSPCYPGQLLRVLISDVSWGHVTVSGVLES